MSRHRRAFPRLFPGFSTPHRGTQHTARKISPGLAWGVGTSVASRMMDVRGWASKPRIGTDPKNIARSARKIVFSDTIFGSPSFFWRAVFYQNSRNLRGVDRRTAPWATRPIVSQSPEWKKTFQHSKNKMKSAFSPMSMEKTATPLQRSIWNHHVHPIFPTFSLVFCGDPAQRRMESWAPDRWRSCTGAGWNWGKKWVEISRELWMENDGIHKPYPISKLIFISIFFGYSNIFNIIGVSG